VEKILWIPWTAVWLICSPFVLIIRMLRRSHLVLLR
jgi:hypothetical protein